MKCIYCDNQQPERGFFCPSCYKQTKCKYCNELLLKDVLICIICGETTGQKITLSNVNTIEFSETETERTFKASFTDTVGQSISDSFGMILTNRIGSKKYTTTSLPSINSDFEHNEDSHENVESVDILSSEITPIPLQDIPTLKDQDIPTLKDIKLRDLAKSETEWVLVYAYHASAGGEKVFTREDIVQLYKDTERFNINRSKNLSQNIRRIVIALFIKSTNNTDYILLDKGKEKAIQIFRGNSNETSKKKSSTNGDTTKTKKSINFKVLTELNLRPNEKISLKDFAARYVIKSTEELSLIIVYYLKNELAVTVTPNHIYTCLKELGKKIPQHFKQTLINQKNKKNWIDIEDWNDIKFTISGMNYIEHDITKA